MGAAAHRFTTGEFDRPGGLLFVVTDVVSELYRFD